MINNEHSKSNITTGELNESNVNVDGDAESKPKTNGKSTTRKE